MGLAAGVDPRRLSDLADELEDLATAEALLTATGTAANLASDAQIAAAAQRLNGTVHSADTDFGRFPKVTWHNPLDT
jgi:predicted nucleic acid-binding protein